MPPAFGTGAFRGSIVDPETRVLDSRQITDPAPRVMLRPLRIRPVRVTEFSVGNQFRAFVEGIALEWWRFRGRMSGEYFQAAPEEFTRVPNRRMARVRRLTKVVPNRQAIYRAPQYGPRQGAAIDYTGG